MFSALHKSSVLKDLLFAERIGKISSDDKVLLLWIIDDADEKKIVDQGGEVLQNIQRVHGEDLFLKRQLYMKALPWKLLCSWALTLFFMVFGDYILRKDNSLLVCMFLPDTISLVTGLLPGMVLFVKRLFLLRILYLYADKCLICHEKHGACDRVITDCGHVYGGSCLEPWIQVRS